MWDIIYLLGHYLVHYLVKSVLGHYVGHHVGHYLVKSLFGHCLGHYLRNTKANCAFIADPGFLG